MGVQSETVEQAPLSRARHGGDHATPGAILVFSAGEPMQGVFPIDDEPLNVGRGSLRGTELKDSFMSRRHSIIAREGNEWVITDCGSRNGTAVDGKPITGTVRGSELCIVRAGETLLLLCEDVRPFQQARIEPKDDGIIGPRMRPLFDKIRRAAASGGLHITGETGSGKEIAARAFHAYSPNANGPFVPVNCAAIPEGLAERLLFGARKGAYSGATSDVRGYLQEAHGGTLFLDEVGELDLSVQAKLLRVLESGEVIPLGASRAINVDLRICSATHRDLREAVANQSFREDLYYRVARPLVKLLPLRERPEEIPFFIDRELRRISPDLMAHTSLIEACLQRPWPGNVRELIVEVKDAGTSALEANIALVRASHLSASAGEAHAREGSHEGAYGSGNPPGTIWPERSAIEEALRVHDGRVATAARALGLHRNQLRRWLDKHDVDPRRFSADKTTPDADDSG